MPHRCPTEPARRSDLPPRGLGSRTGPFVLAVLAVMLGFVAIYAPTLDYPLVNWDDPEHVYRNDAVDRPQTVSPAERWLPRALGYPMPLTMLSYRLDRWLAYADVPDLQIAHGPGFHRTNVLLGVALVLLFALLCRRLIGAWWWAAVTLCLFALHPLLVEPVAWVTGRKDLLAAVFALASLLAWHSFLTESKNKHLILFVIFGFFALMGKPVAAVVVPVALAWAVVERGPADGWRGLVGAVGRGGLAALLLLAVAASVSVVSGVLWNRAVGGVESGFGVGRTLTRAAMALGMQATNLVWPLDLRPRYLVRAELWSGWHTLGVVLVVALLLLLWRARSLGRPARFGLSLALLAYLPVSNLLPLRRFIADCYLTLPLAGVALVVGAGLARLDGLLVERGRRVAAVVLRGAVVPLLLLLALVSSRQVGIWSSAVALWEHELRHHPNSPQVCRMLGNAQAETGKLDQAVTTYKRCADAFGPDMVANNLATVYYLQGRHRQAAAIFVEILKKHPNDSKALRYMSQIRRHGRSRDPSPSRAKP